MFPDSNLNPSALALAKRAWESILFTHDNRSRPNACLAKGSALRILSRNGSANQSGTRGDSDREREIHELRKAEVDCILSKNYKAKGGGGEHLVFRTEPPDGLIYKATWREQFGFIPAWDENGDLELRAALPSEYFLRCGLANVVFGDDIQLFCVAQDQVSNSGVPSIITTQPFIVGRPAAREEIVNYLEGLGFFFLGELEQKKSGLHDVWYRQEDQVMVCDAVPGNFVRAQDGTLAAIDLPMSLLPP